jgi:putative aldouronate transport system permease protein
MVKDKSFSSKVLMVIVYAFCLTVLGVTLFPFMNVLSTSVSGNMPVMTGSVTIYPKEFTFEAYGRVLSNWLVPRAFFNSVIYSLATTVYGVVVTVMLAYPLSKKNFVLRKPIWGMIMGAAYFSGGLIPLFLLVNSLGLYNTIWSQVLPCAIDMGSLILVRIFINDIATELEESATLDGANSVQIFVRIVLPLITPVVATISLWYAVGKWNDFFNPMIYFKDFDKFPLTVILRDIVIKGSFAEKFTGALTHNKLIQKDLVAYGEAYNARLRYATLMVSVLPILLVYPLLQKYFVQGLQMGAVKG